MRACALIRVTSPGTRPAGDAKRGNPSCPPHCANTHLTRPRCRTIFILMGEYKTHKLDEVFGAMSDATRRAILARLAQSDARVTELASAFPISLNSTSKHIRI